MFIKKVIAYLKKNGIGYACKSQYFQYRLERGIGWQLCGFDVEKAKERKDTVGGKIKISILVPIYNTPIIYLKEMLDSVLCQSYNNWELCLVDASGGQYGEVSDICKRYSQKEERIIYRKIEINKGIVGNTNIGLKLLTGNYIALLDHDDILHPDALERVVKQIQRQNADMVYTDEAVFEQKIERIVSLQIKPGFSPENLRGCNYICHLCVFSKELLRKVGGYRKQFEGSQDYDMVLRLSEQAQKICHIPEVLYYWRRHSGSVTAGIAAKIYASEAGKLAVSEHLNRIKLSGNVIISNESEVVYRVIYDIEKKHEKMLFMPYEGASKTRIVKNTEYVLLIQEGIADLNENDVEILESFANRQEIGMVTGTVINNRGKILQGPNVILEKGEIMHLFVGNPLCSVSLMNRMLYAQNIEIVGAGFYLMRRELYQQYEKVIQVEKYSTGILQKISLELSSQGYQNIFVPWIKAVCKYEKRIDFGMKQLPVEYEGYVDRYANPLYGLFRKWIRI